MTARIAPMHAFAFGTVRQEGYVDIRPEDLSRLPKETRYIDVREPSEFYSELGHLPRAELIPLATLEKRAKDWDREAPLLLICRSGRRSAEAAVSLRAMGFALVANLAGGMLAATNP